MAQKLKMHRCATKTSQDTRKPEKQSTLRFQTMENVILRLDTLNYKVKGMLLTVETLKSNRLANISKLCVVTRSWLWTPTVYLAAAVADQFTLKPW